MGMENLKYISTERYIEGVVSEVSDCAITIDLKGRLGKLKVARRMIISDHEIKLGHEVGFMMSFPEVLSNEVDEDYAENAKKQLEIKKKNEKNK